MSLLHVGEVRPISLNYGVRIQVHRDLEAIRSRTCPDDFNLRFRDVLVRLDDPENPIGRRGGIATKKRMLIQATGARKRVLFHEKGRKVATLHLDFCSIEVDTEREYLINGDLSYSYNTWIEEEIKTFKFKEQMYAQTTND